MERFGLATERAVRAFYERYDVVSSGGCMRSVALQDDTAFPPLASWSQLDSSAIRIAEPWIVATLAAYLGLDLAPLRLIGDASDGAS